MWVRVPPPSLPRKGLLWLCERLKGNMRRELRNEKSPFNCTDFASPNRRIYRLMVFCPDEDTPFSLACLQPIHDSAGKFCPDIMSPSAVANVQTDTKDACFEAVGQQQLLSTTYGCQPR